MSFEIEDFTKPFSKKEVEDILMKEEDIDMYSFPFMKNYLNFYSEVPLEVPLDFRVMRLQILFRMILSYEGK